MQKKSIIISLVMIFMFITGDVFSQYRRMGRGERLNEMHPPPGFGHMRGMCFEDDDYMREKLNLNDDQIKTIGNLNKQFGDRLALYRNKLQPLRQKLKTLLLSNDIDLDKIRVVLKEISDVELEVRITKIEHRLAIEKVFTPGQREILNKEKRWMRHRDD